MKIYPKLNERRMSIKEAREGLYAGGEWVQINVSNARSSRATACHKQQWRPKSIQLNNAEPSLFECGYLRNKKRNISYRNSFEKSKSLAGKIILPQAMKPLLPLVSISYAPFWHSGRRQIPHKSYLHSSATNSKWDICHSLTKNKRKTLSSPPTRSHGLVLAKMSLRVSSIAQTRDWI